MKKTILVSLATMALTMLIPTQAWAVRFSTYLEGTVVQKTTHQMVLNSEKGTYWIDIEKRPVSFTRRTGPDRIGFWVGLDQIKRFRPVVAQTVKHMPTVGPIMISKAHKTKTVKRKPVVAQKAIRPAKVATVQARSPGRS